MTVDGKENGKTFKTAIAHYDHLLHKESVLCFEKKRCIFNVCKKKSHDGNSRTLVECFRFRRKRDVDHVISNRQNMPGKSEGQF